MTEGGKPMEERKKGIEVGKKCKYPGYYRCSECESLQYFDEGDEFDYCQTCGEEDIVWIMED